MVKGQFSKRIVAFVDILGFKEKVEKAGNSPLEAEAIYGALNRIHELKTDNEGEGVMNMRLMGVEVTTFSDSAVISYPAKEDSLLMIIIAIIHLQLDLAIKNVLIRGGITIGDLYHDGSIVYGPALNKAHLLESKVAIYPRIIVDDAAIQQYYQYANGDRYDIADLQSVIRKDSDGLYFVDMLKQDQEMDNPEDYFAWLSDLRTIIVQGLEHKDITVKMKYQWLKEYFNAVVNDDRAFYPVPEEALYDVENSFRNAYRNLNI